MNFEESILPVTRLLTDNGYSISENSIHFVKYVSKSSIISIAYDNRERLIYIQIGLTNDSLVELTTKAIKAVFNEDQFQFQSTITIDNFLSFLKGSGNLILAGDTSRIKELIEYSDQQSEIYTAKILHLQNLQFADNAWKKKNYTEFIKFIERADQNLLSGSYLKKYKIALSKS